MKDKIIMAYCINVGNANKEEIANHMKEIQKTFLSEDMIQYFIPIIDGDSRVECVYPKYVLGEEVDEDFKAVIKRLDEHVKKITDEQQD